MAKKMLRILMLPIYEEPYEMEVEDTLENLQHLVTGYIETVTLSDAAVMVCNEEGAILHMTPNRVVTIGKHQIVMRGNCFIVGTPPYSETFESLSDEEVERFKKEYALKNCNRGRIMIRNKDNTWRSVDMNEEGNSFIYYDLLQADADVPYKFFGADAAKKMGTTIKPEDYKRVYHAATRYSNEMNAHDICERLFTEHNTVITDRSSHSMSVSDILVLHLPSGDEYYYADSFGFAKLDGFVYNTERR